MLIHIYILHAADIIALFVKIYRVHSLQQWYRERFGGQRDQIQFSVPHGKRLVDGQRGCLLAFP